MKSIQYNRWADDKSKFFGCKLVSILPLQTAESFRWQNISFWNVMTQSHMIIFHDKHYDNSNLRKTIYTLHAINRVHIFFHQMFIAICI